MLTRFRFSQLKRAFVLGAILAIVFAFILPHSAGVVHAQTTTIPPYGKIAGVVFVDFNGNGVQDSGEPGVANVGIAVLRPGTAYFGIYVITDPDGTYEVDKLLVGFYTVLGSVPGGFVTIDPAYEAVSVNDGETATADFRLYRNGMWLPYIGQKK